MGIASMDRLAYIRTSQQRDNENPNRNETMTKLSGKTYEWKKELKRAGFEWNAATKTWDREKTLDTSIHFDAMILNGIADGDLRIASESLVAANRSMSANERTHEELYDQYAHFSN